MHVGWDWASASHDVTVIADDGTHVDRWSLAHTEDGLAQTLARLRRHGAPWELPVAIETSRGLVVDRLLAAGHPVVPVHPNAFHAVRPRWGAARAKTDAGDSFKLADYLRTDGHRLRSCPPTCAGTPELLTRLREAPHAVSRIGEDTVAELVRAQVRLLRTLLATIDELDHAIAAALPEHPWAGLLAPLPRIGTINLAQVVGEVGPILERATDCEQLAAETGMVPVTYQSGKVRTVSFRVAVSHNARQSLATFADNSRHASPWAAEIYRQARARGKRHPHAIRILARAWLRVIWACYRTNTPYQPAQHRGAQRVA